MGFLGWVLPQRTRPMGAHSAVYIKPIGEGGKNIIIIKSNNKSFKSVILSKFVFARYFSKRNQNV
jgi:hypothetical protein